MKVMLNPDPEAVSMVREGLRRTGGYCPCRAERTPDTKCMCKEFRDQIKDPAYQGFCHCLLYYKSLGDGSELAAPAEAPAEATAEATA